MPAKLLILFSLMIVSSSAKSQLFGSEWTDGSYDDLHGHRFTGLVQWSPAGNGFINISRNNIAFKPDPAGKKQKIVSDSIRTFRMGTDSFIVSHFAALKNMPFLQIIVDNPTKLYLSVITGTSGSAGSYTKYQYYYGTNPDDLIEVDRQSFIDVMSKIMADNAAVVELIKKKKYKFGSIEDLVYYYKNGKEPEVNYTQQQ